MDYSSEGAVYNFYLVEVYYTTLRVTRVNEEEDKLFLSLYSEKDDAHNKLNIQLDTGT